MTPSSLSLNKDTVAPRLDDALESVNQMYPVGSVSTTRKMTHPLMVQLPVVSWKPRSSAFVKKTSDYRWSVKSQKRRRPSLPKSRTEIRLHAAANEGLSRHRAL